MASEYFGLGPTPGDEDCIQVGSPHYHSHGVKESRIFIRQLQRQFPDLELKNCRLAVKSFPHDYGTYHDVVVYYDPDNKESVEQALEIEGNTPANWDDKAKIEHDNLFNPFVR